MQVVSRSACRVPTSHTGFSPYILKYAVGRTASHSLLNLTAPVSCQSSRRSIHTRPQILPSTYPSVAPQLVFGTGVVGMAGMGFQDALAAGRAPAPGASRTTRPRRCRPSSTCARAGPGGSSPGVVPGDAQRADARRRGARVPRCCAPTGCRSPRRTRSRRGFLTGRHVDAEGEPHGPPVREECGICRPRGGGCHEGVRGRVRGERAAAC